MRATESRGWGRRLYWAKTGGQGKASVLCLHRSSPWSAHSTLQHLHEAPGHIPVAHGLMSHGSLLGEPPQGLSLSP